MQGAPESKKLLAIRILEILRKETDETHSLTKEAIVQKLKSYYGIDVNRKTVSAKVSLLLEAGYEIVDIGKKKGIALIQRDFEESEVRMLIDCVLCCRHIPENYSNDLIEKLTDLQSSYFNNNVKHIKKLSKEFSKLDNKEIFKTIDIIEDAIENEYVVNYKFNKYNIKGELEYSSSQFVSPYAMLLHNQKYYLMGYSDYMEGQIVFHRIDRITGMKKADKKYKKTYTPITKVKGYETGINYKELAVSRPYFFNDKLEDVEMIITNNMVDQIFDWFGNEAKFVPIKDDENHMIVKIKTSPKAIQCWALQYLSSVEVTKPLYLKQKIEQALEEGLAKYRKSDFVVEELK